MRVKWLKSLKAYLIPASKTWGRTVGHSLSNRENAIMAKHVIVPCAPDISKRNMVIKVREVLRKFEKKMAKEVQKFSKNVESK